MPDFTEKKWALGLLLATSIFVHFLFFGHPNEIVFDEVHFGKFISSYYTHEYYFDIHPPLGKLIIAGFAKLFDFKPEFSFAEIGNEFPDNKYLVLRFLPSVAGSLLAVIIFLLATELGYSRIGSLAAGGLIVLESAILGQTRFILLDAFLLSFGFSALYFYFRYRNTGNWKYLILTGLGAAMAMSIKWTGLTFLALPLLLELFELGKTRRLQFFSQKIGTLLLLPLVFYMGVYAIHFSLLTKTGTGDAFMSLGFQSTLEGNSVQYTGPKPSFLDKFIELNIEMYRSNQRLTADHPYGSKWYTWPIMQRPIYYWVNGDQRIYLFGNPVIWWASTVAIIFLLLTVISESHKPNLTSVVLLLGYVINLLPFIGIHRVMFLYHYLAALVFALLALAYVIDHEKKKHLYFKVLFGLAMVAFIYFAPLTYGLSLKEGAYQQRTWLPTWR
jgi:dolichyl-phosphate-mannose-protein mannosyltransferase